MDADPATTQDPAMHTEGSEAVESCDTAGVHATPGCGEVPTSTGLGRSVEDNSEGLGNSELRNKSANFGAVATDEAASRRVKVVNFPAAWVQDSKTQSGARCPGVRTSPEAVKKYCESGSQPSFRSRPTIKSC